MAGLCALVSGGVYSPLAGIQDADYIIACDKGLEYCRKEGIRPDLLVGDFDSYEGEIPSDIPRLDLPCEKDDTDTLAALRHGLSLGYDSFTIYCALGGRMDHLLANVQTAAFAAEQGARVTIADESNPMFVFKDGSMSFPRRENFYISVFCLSDSAHDLSITGAKYNVSHGELSNVFPIGVSNEWASDLVTVSVEQGIIMVVQSRR